MSAWDPGDDSAVILYHRQHDPHSIIGRQFFAGPRQTDGTAQGCAEDAALVMSEPLGAMALTVRTDHTGVQWVGFGNSDLPTVLPDVLARLRSPSE